MVYYLVDIKKKVVKEERLQKLKEWQEKRKIMKEQEKKKQLKPFYTVVQVNPVKITVNSRPVTRLQVKNAASKFSTTQYQQKPVPQAQGNNVIKPTYYKNH